MSNKMNDNKIDRTEVDEELIEKKTLIVIRTIISFFKKKVEKVIMVLVSILLAGGLIVTDQIIKSKMVEMFSDSIVNGYNSVEKKFIPGVIYLRYLENRGAAWSSFSDKRWFLILVSSLFMLAVLYVIIKMPSAKKYISAHVLLSMIVAGGIGNMIDRVKQGYVVDYLGLDFWKSYPIFNFADICVVLGVLGIFILFIFVYKENDLDFLRFKKKASADMGQNAENNEEESENNDSEEAEKED